MNSSTSFDTSFHRINAFPRPYITFVILLGILLETTNKTIEPWEVSLAESWLALGIYNGQSGNRRSRCPVCTGYGAANARRPSVYSYPSIAPPSSTTSFYHFRLSIKQVSLLLFVLASLSRRAWDDNGLWFFDVTRRKLKAVLYLFCSINPAATATAVGAPGE